MRAEALKEFRLVGGTALSLQLGHRMSVDIDLFTDAPYGSIDFELIETYLIENFEYVHGNFGGGTNMGKSYLIGIDQDHVVKLDIYYSNDPFFQAFVDQEGIRMASVDEIIAMKIDIIHRETRKKDFWDLHEVLPNYSINDMIELHRKRFNWTHDPGAILEGFAKLSDADEDFDPVCLRNKEWVFIKEDFEEAMENRHSG
jgi:hypothetical protein